MVSMHKILLTHKVFNHSPLLLSLCYYALVSQDNATTPYAAPLHFLVILELHLGNVGMRNCTFTEYAFFPWNVH